MTVDTGHELWVVPPMRAVWIPANRKHRVQMNSRVSMRTAYFKSGDSLVAWQHCVVVPVSPLLRELLVAATEFSSSEKQLPRTRHICDLIIEELVASTVLPLHLPHPRSARLRRITDLVLDDLSISLSLEELSKIGSLSQRTISRLFTTETGLTFGQWRQQAILIRALQRLADHEPVTTVALDLGYRTPSAFIYMFRNAFGMTPARYFAAQSTRP